MKSRTSCSPKMAAPAPPRKPRASTSRSTEPESRMAQTANIVTLKPRTLEAFEEYIRSAEQQMEPSLSGSAAFLWSDLDSARTQRVRQQHVIAQLWSGDSPAK